MIAAAQYKLTSASMLPLEVRRQDKATEDTILTKIEHDLEILTKQFILSKQGIETFVQSKLDKLFGLRITCLNWLIKNRKQTVIEESDWATRLIDFKTNDRFSFLYQNILLAIQANIQGIQSLMSPNDAQSEMDFTDWQPIPKSSLQTYFNLMRLTALPFDFHLYQTWVIASLQIEFGVIATLVIHDKKLPINDFKINELAILTAYAAQTFRTISMEMSGVKSVSSTPKGNVDTLVFESISTLDESPFNIQYILENHTIQWENFSLVQQLFKHGNNASFKRYSNHNR
ncbi:MAG: hypothetical protein RLZZ628_1211 [Bacteroidota bacterium]|jgi:hypothetical protein